MRIFTRTLSVCSFIALTGCSTQAPTPNSYELAAENIRMQMLDIARETIENINQTNKIVYSKDPRSDWTNHLDMDDTINNVIDFGYLGDGLWTGTFSNLMSEIEIRTGYTFIDVLDDAKITEKTISLNGKNTTALKALKSAYNKVRHENIDIVVRPEQKKIVLRAKCVDSFQCDGLYDLSDSSKSTSR